MTFIEALRTGRPMSEQQHNSSTDRRYKKKRRVNKTPASKLEANRAWRAANYERAVASAKKSRQRQDPAKRRSYQLRNRYGLEMDDLNRMRELQQNGCAICATQLGVGFRDLCVDHCHRTGEVRGLVCRRCNRALGLFGDDEHILRSAIEYLQMAAHRIAQGVKAWQVMP